MFIWKLSVVPTIPRQLTSLLTVGDKLPMLPSDTRLSLYLATQVINVGTY
jgi:hypothetical protein